GRPPGKRRHGQGHGARRAGVTECGDARIRGSCRKRCGENFEWHLAGRRARTGAVEEIAHSADVWSWTIFQPSENLRKSSVKSPCGVLSSFIVSFHSPRTKAASGGERRYFEIRKPKLSHLMSLALISFAITLKGSLPACSHVRAGKECQVWRIPVAGHKGFEVMPVPGVLLAHEHIANGCCDLCV